MKNLEVENNGNRKIKKNSDFNSEYEKADIKFYAKNVDREVSESPIVSVSGDSTPDAIVLASKTGVKYWLEHTRVFIGKEAKFCGKTVQKRDKFKTEKFVPVPLCETGWDLVRPVIDAVINKIKKNYSLFMGLDFVKLEKIEKKGILLVVCRRIIYPEKVEYYEIVNKVRTKLLAMDLKKLAGCFKEIVLGSWVLGDRRATFEFDIVWTRSNF